MNAKPSIAVVVACVGLSLCAEFQAGFSRVDMTPPIGTGLSGYSQKRVSDGVKDPLDINAVAFSDGTNRAVVISADVISFRAYFDLSPAAAGVREFHLSFGEDDATGIVSTTNLTNYTNFFSFYNHGLNGLL